MEDAIQNVSNLLPRHEHDNSGCVRLAAYISAESLIDSRRRAADCLSGGLGRSGTLHCDAENAVERGL